MANKTDGRRLLGAILAFLGAVSAAYLAYAVVSAAAPTTNPGGQCGGFECILPPQDLVLAAGAILGVPVLAGTLIVGPIVTAVFLRWARIRGALAGALGAFLGAIFSFAAVVFFYLLASGL